MTSISVIVPCFNQAQYLEDCLQSVLNQSYQNWECIIVNDGSPDHTEEVAKKWLKKDSRFKYLFQENKGVSAARNYGIAQANGEWILPLDGDDYISDNYLQLASQYFATQNIMVIYCRARKFGEMNAEFVLENFSLKNLAVTNPIFCSAFYRKSDWSRINGYDKNMGDGFEDWEFWINMLKDGGVALRLDDFCFYYRIKLVSRNTAVKKNPDKALRYIEAKHLSFFHEQLGTMHHLYKENEENKKVIEVIINKRKLSRFVNQLYSFVERIY